MNTVIEVGDASLEELALLYWSIAQEIDRRDPMAGLDTYAAPHVWNLVAKQIRDHYPTHEPSNKMDKMRIHAERRILEDVALAFAHRFTEDEGFDPPAWLDKCSPDTERYPFSEMWDG